MAQSRCAGSVFTAAVAVLLASWMCAILACVGVVLAAETAMGSRRFGAAARVTVALAGFGATSPP